jgi:O-glycosyl hydrolase
MLFPWNTDPAVTMNQLVNIQGQDEKRPDQYEGIKIVNKYGGYVFGSPWSPPAAWKSNNSANAGGSLKTANYADFANYLNAYTKVFYDNGAPIYAVSMQNEPSYTATGYEGCEYTTAQHLSWWNTSGVGHFTNKNGVTANMGYGGGAVQSYVRTMSGEAHNQLGWLNSVASNATANGNIDIMGRHQYGSGVDQSTENLAWGQTARTNRENANPRRETWMTEYNVNSGNATGYPNDSTGNYMWKFMNQLDLSIRLNKENVFVWWTAKRFYSIIGDADYSSTLDAVLPRGYGLSHYAKFAKEMSQCAVSVSGNNNGGTALGTGNINATSFSVDGTTARATAFVSADGNTISVIIMTPNGTNGSGGQNLGNIRIAMPNGFTIRHAVAMRTSGINTARTVTNAREFPTLNTAKTEAYVNVPAGVIVSVRFTKQ